MAQKLVVGLLILTVVGAVGIGVYDASNNNDSPGTLLAQEGDALPVNLEAEAAAAPDPMLDAALPDTPAEEPAPEAAIAQPVEAQQALGQVGNPWTGIGTITGFDETGLTLQLADAAQIYVELGPQHYWSAQDVTLQEGDAVTVTGFFNGEQYHAATVTAAGGAQMLLRTAEGLPLWSGGANGNDNDGAHNTGAGNAEPQVAIDEWITLEGTVVTVKNNALTFQEADGATLDLQLGQPRFIADQGISFEIGDSIRVIGYWQGNKFNAGEITKLATGERLMLLDPNGRPLWGGPGRNGATQGQTAQTGNPPIDNNALPADNAGQGQGGDGGNGGGNGYQGGRNPDFQAGNANQTAQ